MLHNKGQYGKLFGNIVRKNDPIRYPKNKDESDLTFKEHGLKLNFDFIQTKKCEEGCYLLITYFHENCTLNTSVGYEFTLLARIWDDYDLNPKIINIPFNEYIFGYFEEESINNHFYFFYVPDNIKEIIIQIEGNFFEGFIGGGKKRIINSRKMEGVKNMNITSKKMYIVYQKEDLNELNIINNYISLTFRPIDYYTKTLSFYYFRLLYKIDREFDSDDISIIPLEANVGNLCQPQKIKHEDRMSPSYYCFFILKNNYNQFSLKYSTSTSNQNKDIYIFYAKYYKNNTIIESNILNVFNDIDDIDDNVKFILFKFEFFDNKIRNILLNFVNKENQIYPQIYSSQIYQLSNKNSNNFSFSLEKEEDYSLIISRIQGLGSIDLCNSRYPLKFYISKNFRGNSITFFLNNIQNVLFTGLPDVIFNTKLSYLGNNELREAIYGETMNEIIRNRHFPFFYYINYNINEFMYITFRIINYDQLNATINYNIQGYILDYEYIEKKLNGEFIQLEDPIKGNYNIYSNAGFLNVNRSNIDNKYILILINKEKSNNNNNNNNDNTNLIVQMTPLYQNNDECVLPINQYITGSFNIKKENKGYINYLIQIGKSELHDNQEIMVEFSSNCGEDLNLTFTLANSKISNIVYKDDNGFQTYRLKNLENDICLNVSNPKNIENANFILRYYFTKEEDEYEYIFDKSFKKANIKDNQDNTKFITFEFNNIQINASKTEIEKIKDSTTFKIYGFLFLEKKIINNESINTFASIISQPSNINQTFVNANNPKFNLSFNNISRENFAYKMQIKVHVIINDFYINEHFLVYTFPINLEEELKQNEENKNYLLYVVIGLLVGLIIIIIIIGLIICYKMKKHNEQLQDKVLAISFSTGITEDPSDKNDAQKDEDYETRFI